MEQTDKEPRWFAFVALSGPGQLEVHHGRLRDNDPAYPLLASAGSRYRAPSPGRLPGWAVSLVFFATILADCHLVSL